MGRKIRKPCPNRTRLSFLSLHIIRNFGVGTPPDLGEAINTDVEQRRRL
nr:MAG TPA_asm: hypothetical protein [Caudoviricetes sp.]DAN49964.1 MAG TPA: hypothetical protein [Caudoviricetes sp.]